ncbi:uncharacterized protein LOC119979837 [Tripterygium wilfordii]|uniref:uncharacterized protein LOC119979837 n=1 Tax=Tripterygium wilfordii TaxID=458696 RepID=UPI0018F82164|nr:uncharacterized protein LOC119979837 [Tripterygium wilfordii]
MENKNCMFFSDLVAGQRNAKLKVRVARMWNSRNAKLDDLFMSLDLLLLDEKGHSMLGTITVEDVEHFRSLLIEGNVYHLSDLMIIPARKNYKQTSNENMIQFFGHTKSFEVGCVVIHEFFFIHEGKPTLNSTSTIKIYLNLNIPEVDEFHHRFFSILLHTFQITISSKFASYGATPFKVTQILKDETKERATTRDVTTTASDSDDLSIAHYIAQSLEETSKFSPTVVSKQPKPSSSIKIQETTPKKPRSKRSIASSFGKGKKPMCSST